MTEVLVELRTGYGDGYGVVRINDAGAPVVTNGKVRLLDGMVSVPAGAIVRVIGPVDSPDGLRVRVKRMHNIDLADRAAIGKSTDAELQDAFASPETFNSCKASQVHLALRRLAKKYAE